MYETIASSVTKARVRHIMLDMLHLENVTITLS